MLPDAHNHLQSPRFAGAQPALLAACAEVGVSRMVVNGTRESDWPAVLALAQLSPLVLPSFGLHPWYVSERTPDWQAGLLRHLEAVPSAIGEIGLDRWILGQSTPRAETQRREAEGSRIVAGVPAPMPEQEAVFIWQLGVASERNLPASIHCLQAWGRLFELLRDHPRPARGFLLHSFGGPVEMVPALARLGAYFSFPGFLAQERKGRQRETFRHIPPDRLLVETDAPDQLPPDRLIRHRLTDAAGQALNHPANLPAICDFLAEFLGLAPATLAARLTENFARLFGQP
jgi:TatD DNase family protein